MSVMSSSKLSAQIRSIKSNSTKFREQVQVALVSCAYYAYKDGNVNPFNQLLDAVGSATRIKGLTMWAELHGCVLVKNEKFVLNKSARKEATVTDAASFEEYERDMALSPKWYDSALAGKQPVKSMFDASTYLDHVLKTLDSKGAKDAKAFLQEAVDKYKAADAIIKLKLESLGEALV